MPRWLLALACLASTVVAQPKGWNVPAVDPRGYDPIADQGLELVATTAKILIEGQPIVMLDGGRVAAPYRDADETGLAIRRIQKILEARLQSGGKRHLLLALDKTTPYRLLVEIVISARDAGVAQLHLAVEGREAPYLSAPIHLPKALETPLGLTVSLTATSYIVWSTSGLEGTRAKPKSTVAAASPTAIAEVGKALVEIAKRRWPDGKRDAASKWISIQGTATIPFQRVAELIGVARMTVDRKPLFPDVALSPTFE